MDIAEQWDSDVTAVVHPELACELLITEGDDPHPIPGAKQIVVRSGRWERRQAAPGAAQETRAEVASRRGAQTRQRALRIGRGVARTFGHGYQLLCHTRFWQRLRSAFEGTVKCG